MYVYNTGHFLNIRLITNSIFAILAGLDICNGSTLSRIHVDPSSGHFVDELGRIRLFRGINSVIKEDPWYDPKLLNKDRQKQISDLGFNVVRLGAMWTGKDYFFKISQHVLFFHT